MPENIELSERELEVLRLVATGASNKQIAHRLSISKNTVKVHLRNIFAKTGTGSRTEAAMHAVRIGLVTPDMIQGDGELLFPEGTSGYAAGASGGRRFDNPVLDALDRWGLWGNPWAMSGAVALVLLMVATALILLFSRGASTQASGDIPVPTAVPRWQEKASLPTARAGLAVVAYNEQIYAVGGFTEEATSQAFELYDPASDQWSRLPEKPTAVSDISAAALGGRIFVPGGRLPDDQVSDVLEVYDVQASMWVRGAPLPIPLAAYTLVAFEGRLLLFGGWDGSRYVDMAFAYDPSRDQWETLTPMLTPRGYAGASIAGGRVFVFGGTNGGGVLVENEEYQPALEGSGESPWILREPLPEGRHSMGVVNIVDSIYIIGGEGEKPLLSSLKYFPQRNEWEEIELQLTQPWSGFGLVIVGPNLHALGGLVDDRVVGQNITYQAIFTIAIPVLR